MIQLLFAAVAAGLALAGCSKQEAPQSNQAPNAKEKPKTEDKKVRTLQLSSEASQKEYLKFCEIYVGGKSVEECNTYDADRLRTLAPGKEKLYPYIKGILTNTKGYNYGEAEFIFGDRLRLLKGAAFYLSGTENCRLDSSVRCSPLNEFISPENKMLIPQPLDAFDDIVNLMGMWLVYQGAFSKGGSPSCSVTAETIDASRWCDPTKGYTAHHLVLTPVGLKARGIPGNVPGPGGITYYSGSLSECH